MLLHQEKIRVSFHYQVAFDNTDQMISIYEGSAKNIDQISNPVAKKLAKAAIEEKCDKKLGIWRVNLLGKYF